MEAAVDRVALDKFERIMHPAHIPLEVEAEAMLLGAPSDAGKRSRLFSYGNDSGIIFMNEIIGLTHKFDGFDILLAAPFIGHPFPIFFTVIEVEHRGDCIDAQAIYVEPFNPRKRTRDQEIADLMSPVIKD